MKTILIFVAIYFAIIFAKYMFNGLWRFTQEISDDDFIEQQKFKFLTAGACLLYIYIFLDESVHALFVILSILALALATYEYKSSQKEVQQQNEKIQKNERYRQEILKSGEGWTKQDVLNKFRTTIYYRQYGSITTTQGWRCAACSKNLYKQQDAELDHILPKSKYPHPATSEKNLQILCRSCNAHKHAYDGNDWRKTIHRRRRAKNKKSK